MKSSQSRAVDTPNKNNISEQPNKDEDASGVMTRSQLRRLYVEDTAKTTTPKTLKKIQTRKSIVNSVNNSPSKKSAILKDKLTPIKNSRILKEKSTPTKSSKLNDVKNGKYSVPMADNEGLDHFSKEQLLIDNELTKVSKEKTLPVRRSRKLSGVGHETEAKIKSSESVIVKKGRTSEFINDIGELHHSSVDQSHIDKGLINMPKGKATPIRRSRRLSGNVHGTGSYTITEEGIKEKSLKLNTVKKGETAAVMSDIDEFDVSEDEQSHTGKRSLENVKAKATRDKCSRKHTTENDDTQEEMLNTSSKLSSGKKIKIAEAQDSNEFDLSKVEQSHLECSDHSIHAEDRTPSKSFPSLKTKKKENTDKSEKEMSPGKKSGFSVSSENNDSDEDRNKKIVSPRVAGLPPKKKYASYQDLSGNVSEFENRSKSSIKEKVSPKRNVINLSEDDNDSKKKEKVNFPSKKMLFSENKMASCPTNSERAYRIKLSSEEDSVSDFEASPKTDEKVTKSVTKCHFQDKITQNKIVEKENISSSDTIQLPSSCKKRSPSPVFKNRVREDIQSESSDSDSDAESRKAIMESAQKRIIQNLSTSESESKKFVRPLKNLVEEPSDSDSAPEQMSFSTGRQMEKDWLKNAVESINREKQRKKERRKQRLEKYKQQKEEKLIRLKEKRASQEDASCSSSEESGYEEDNTATVSKSNKIRHVRQEKENLDDLPKSKVKKFHFSDDSDEIKVKKEKKEKKRKHEQNEVQSIGNLRRLPTDVVEKLPEEIPLKLPKFDVEETSKEKPKSKKSENVKEKRQDFRHRTDVDYIPLSSQSSTEFGVMPLEILARASKSMAERAVEFRQKMLYGSHIKRGPANATTIYQQKLKAAGRNRFVR